MKAGRPEGAIEKSRWRMNTSPLTRKDPKNASLAANALMNSHGSQTSPALPNSAAPRCPYMPVIKSTHAAECAILMDV